MIGIAAAAKHLGVSERRVRQLCAQKRIPQATKLGGKGSWFFTGPPTVIQASPGHKSVIAMKKPRQPKKGKK